MLCLAGKPYRLTQIELAYPDFEVYMFRQACTWSSFTIDRQDYHWNYKTFLCTSQWIVLLYAVNFHPTHACFKTCVRITCT